MLSNSCHFSKEELISISTKELNKILQEKGISKKIRQIIKEERRTLKNRRYVSQQQFEAFSLFILKIEELSPIPTVTSVVF